jgi:hypothetical protein
MLLIKADLYALMRACVPGNTLFPCLASYSPEEAFAQGNPHSHWSCYLQVGLGSLFLLSCACCWRQTCTPSTWSWPAKDTQMPTPRACQFPASTRCISWAPPMDQAPW